MKPQIVKLDEASLARMGFDRVTIAALRNMVRVTGVESDSPTVPQLAQSASDAGQVIASLREQISVLQGIIEIIQLNPEPISHDLSEIEDLALMPETPFVQQVEHITTEVRQIAEAVASIGTFLQTEVRQNAERIAQISEHFNTEIRQVADQQIVNANMIQELKQGTML